MVKGNIKLILNTYLTTHHYFEKKIPQEGVNIKKKMLHLPNNAIGLKSGSSKEKQKTFKTYSSK